MKLRTFTAPDMPTAMKQIKAELGPNAVILATQSERGRKGVRVTAAVEPSEEKTTFQEYKDTVEFAHKRQHKREWQEQLTHMLGFHRTPERVVSACVKAVEYIDLDALIMLGKFAATPSKAIVQVKALALILEKTFDFSPLPLNEAGKRFGFVGPVGAGKTLTTAKLATKLVMAKQAVSVVTLDNKRAGGMEQLAGYTDILNITLHTASSRSELQDVCKSIPLTHITLIDTAGCNPNNFKEIETLSHTLDTAGIEQVLVVPAGLDSFETADMAKAFANPALKRLLITRLDAATRFGNVLAAAHAGELAFANYSASARVVDACTALDPAILAQFLLQHTHHTQ
jgi:flagellar biosynthesis protein FlhF